MIEPLLQMRCIDKMYKHTAVDNKQIKRNTTNIKCFLHIE